MNIRSWVSRLFNLEVLKKNRWPWVDYLRGIAILLVVYRHALLGIERSGITIPETLSNANMIFYSFRMPLFFILSGIFINSSLAKRTIGRIAFLKFENLLYPYFIWATFQITLQIVFSQFSNADRGWQDYLYLFYQPRNLDQFWYLPALFNTTMIYILIKKYLKIPGWSQLILGLGFYYLSPYFQHISMLSDWMEFYIFFALGDVISNVFFKDASQRFLKKGWLLILLIPIFAVVQLYYLRNEESYYLNDPVGKTMFLGIALSGCFTMLVLAFRLQIWNILLFLRVLGFHSLYIYVMHVFIAALTRALMTKVLHVYDPLIILPVCIFMGVTIPVIFYNLLVKDNILWFLFSLRKPSSKSTPAPEEKKGKEGMAGAITS